MPSTPAARLAALYRYPVKGLSAEQLQDVAVEEGAVFPFDRAYAIEFRDSGFDEENPQHVSKSKFLQMALFNELAPLKTSVDTASKTLTVRTPEGEIAVEASLDTPEGRRAIEDAFAKLLKSPPTRPLRLVAGRTIALTDQRRPLISLINLASVADLGSAMAMNLDPARFRGNLYIDGWDAWAETGLIGKTLRIGDAEFSVEKAIERCVATELDLETGTRNAPVLDTLRECYGHLDCGIFLAVTKPGTVRPGDEVTILG
ncbi:MAG: MOSC domain-containing protein [Hyphomicrobiales bacterium]|nr:MAG: MOSC domain-containing protein [Hyphomicrobiales bacterium]